MTERFGDKSSGSALGYSGLVPAAARTNGTATSGFSSGAERTLTLASAPDADPEGGGGQGVGVWAAPRAGLYFVWANFRTEASGGFQRQLTLWRGAVGTGEIIARYCDPDNSNNLINGMQVHGLIYLAKGEEVNVSFRHSNNAVNVKPQADSGGDKLNQQFAAVYLGT